MIDKTHNNVVVLFFPACDMLILSGPFPGFEVPDLAITASSVFDITVSRNPAYCIAASARWIDGEDIDRAKTWCAGKQSHRQGFKKEMCTLINT